LQVGIKAAGVTAPGVGSRLTMSSWGPNRFAPSDRAAIFLGAAIGTAPAIRVGPPTQPRTTILPGPPLRGLSADRYRIVGRPACPYRAPFGDTKKQSQYLLLFQFGAESQVHSFAPGNAGTSRHGFAPIARLVAGARDYRDTGAPWLILHRSVAASGAMRTDRTKLRHDRSPAARN